MTKTYVLVWNLKVYWKAPPMPCCRKSIGSGRLIEEKVLFKDNRWRFTPVFAVFHACLGWMSDSDNYFSNFFGKIANVEWKYLNPCLMNPLITISVLNIRFNGCFTVNCVTKLGTSNCVEVNCNGWKYVTVCNFPVFIWVIVAWLLSEPKAYSLFIDLRCTLLNNGSNITKLSLVSIQ